MALCNGIDARDGGFIEALDPQGTPLPCATWHCASSRSAISSVCIRGFRSNALHDDFTVKDGNARCWPHTERLKAALQAATVTSLSQYRSMAEAAATSLLRYLNTSVPGLWLDEQAPSGELRESAVPASTFYHLVGAIAALDLALAR
jgi:mannose/cellobiose epimerase-like protein (N-acyl-D-glucosamine 2-epimerase family)